jgi:hypothetical protein
MVSPLSLSKANHEVVLAEVRVPRLLVRQAHHEACLSQKQKAPGWTPLSSV